MSDASSVKRRAFSSLQLPASVRWRIVIDEIPGAYKDIEQVMRNQSDLVEIVAELKQVICVKG